MKEQNEKFETALSAAREKARRHWRQAFTRLQKDLALEEGDNRYSKTLLALLDEKELQKVKNLLAPELKEKMESLAAPQAREALSEVSLKRFEFEIQRSVLASETSLSEDSQIALQNMSLASLKEFVAANPENAALVAGQIEPSRFAAVFNELSRETVESILNAKNAPSKEEFERQSLTFSGSRRSSPFLSKLRESLKNLDASKELELFTALKRENKHHEIKELALCSLPGFLLSKLPEVVVQEAFNESRPAEFARFLGALDKEEDRQFFLNSVAPSGKKRETIDLELSEIENSPQLRKKIAAQKEGLLKSAREKIMEEARNKMSPEQTLAIIEEWLAQ